MSLTAEIVLLERLKAILVSLTARQEEGPTR
jgi:hypothetical protein